MQSVKEIERIKLEAAYSNNMAVGCALGGVFVPYLTFIEHAGSFLKSIEDAKKLTDIEAYNVVLCLFAFVITALLARLLHAHAKNILGRIEE